jgi:hypothetical protein
MSLPRESLHGPMVNPEEFQLGSGALLVGIQPVPRTVPVQEAVHPGWAH